MSMSEKEFWSWFSAERAKYRQVEEARRLEEAPTLFEWLEAEIAEAEEKAFRTQFEQGEQYWTGYADSLKTLLNAIKMRRVRV